MFRYRFSSPSDLEPIMAKKKSYTFTQPKSLARVYDMKGMKSVSAYVLLYKGRYAGRIVANWSDNPNGSVCTAAVMIFDGPLSDMPVTTGKAGGYGYDKMSAAVNEAICKVASKDSGLVVPDFGGAGMSVVGAWFEEHGYKIHDII